MKKVFFTIALLAIIASSHACEICGCGVGNYYIGLLPHFSHRFIGLRYSFNSFHTRINDDPDEFSRDFYQTAEIWTGWNIGRRFQVLAFIPYNFNHQLSDEGTKQINGLGDVALLVNYKLIDQPTANGSQQLWIGGGIKLPTGKFTIENGDPDVASVANTQRGSGSIDYLVNAAYTVSMRKWGVTTAATYKINTDNKEEYRFGNKFTASSYVYHAAAAGNTVISPNLGLIYEHSERSVLTKSDIDLTGGSILLASAGVEFGFNKVAVGLNVQLPVSQNFAEGQTKSNIKGMLHVSFAL